MECDHKRTFSRWSIITCVSFSCLIFLLYLWQRSPPHRRPQDGPDLYLGKWRHLPEVSLLRQDATSWRLPCNPLIPALYELPSPPAPTCNLNGDHRAPFLVVGVMTTAQARWRRDLYRSTMPVDGVNVVRFFVLGETQDSQSMEDLKLESELYGDILLLRGMKENGDGGKSYFFFRAVAEVFKDKISPRFVMKTDDDTILVVQNILKSLQPYVNECSTVYWGRLIGTHREYSTESCVPYMGGAAYIMSWNIVEWLNSGPQLRQEDIRGYEDVRTGVFIQNIPQSHNVTIVDVGNLGGDLRLSPKSKKADAIWGVALNARTMYIHKAKQLEDFTFALDWMRSGVPVAPRE